MGPITAISTAPVAIGNSIRGASSVSRSIPGGVVLTGRDFMFNPVGTAGSITNWCTVGGCPLAPAAFGDSSIRQYLQMYQKFRWRRCAVHYITSSSTASTGDVMFYHAKNRDSVYLNQTSPFLLPVVISDPDTILGPQWTNHSALLTLQGTWKSTDYGMQGEPNDYSEGEVFLLSRTTTTDSPGYVLFDYEIEFKELQISTRLLNLPLPKAQWTNVPLGWVTTTLTNAAVIVIPPAGNNLSGVGGTVNPTGLANGDIYKVILDVSNSTSIPTALAILLLSENNGFLNVTIQDGTTIYASFNGASYLLYPSYADALVQSNPFKFGGVTSVNATTTLQTWMSYVGSFGPVTINPNY